MTSWGSGGRTSARARQRQAEIQLARAQVEHQLRLGAMLEALAMSPDASEEDIAAWEEQLAENDSGGGLIVNRGAGSRFDDRPRINYSPAPTGPGVHRTDTERAEARLRSGQIRLGLNLYFASVGYQRHRP